MAYGLFGAFIFGFLGTAMPRMLSAPPLGKRNVMALLCFHAAMVVAFIAQKITLGDALFLALLCFFIGLMVRRARHRKDIPPPGFVLVGLAFMCVLVGSLLALAEPWMEDASGYWV